MGGKIALIDTEHGSASKYADEFQFDTLQLQTYNPQTYIDAIQAAEDAGYETIIIDSLSHAWSGKGGALELVDQYSAASKGNSYVAWGKVTPLWNELLSSILRVNAHVIGTMRSKMDYVIEQDRNGKSSPRKVGMAPIFREGGEYEFDVVGELTLDHTMVISKTRCRELDEAVIEKPGAALAEMLQRWLEGEPLPQVAEIDALGIEYMGESQWKAEGREAAAASISEGGVSTLEQLTTTEASRLLAAMQRKVHSKRAADEAEQKAPQTETQEQPQTEPAETE